MKKQPTPAIKNPVPNQHELNILLEHYQNGRYEDSEKLALILTDKFQTHPFGWKVLGAVLNQTGRISEGLIACQKSVELAPENAEAHYNLGNTLHKLGRFEEAEVSCRKSIALAPENSNAHYNLGNTLHKLGRFEEAEESYRQTITLKPDYAEAYNNMGNALKDKGDTEAAIDSYKQALKIKPDFSKAYNNMVNILNRVVFTKPISGLQEIIISIIDRKNNVNPVYISHAAISLLKFEPVVKELFEKHFAGEAKQSLERLISNLSGVPLLYKLMSVCPLPDLELEAVFTDIRSALLASVTEIENSPEVLRFQSALALQCFINEYVYNQNDKETTALAALEVEVGEVLLKGKQPKPQLILCLATYKALHQYKWCDLLALTSSIEEVVTRQIIEPKQESLLKSNMLVLQKITNKVSSKVREQYEESPYPRWVNMGSSLNPAPLSKTTKKLKLRLFDKTINDVEAPNILIAGCGTGQHSIRAASKFKNAKVLAVDLSLSSLAYAKRKTQELGFQNIDYMQADILDLGMLDRKFDIIESAGVLHHLDEPITGWRSLTDCLELGGLMKIGLYSELARQFIVRMQEEINQSGIGSSDVAIRSFRSDVINSSEEHHKRVRLAKDFYSLSELRDLLFHVQEHRFTIPQLKDCLSELDLKFCGFEADVIVRDFKLTNTGADDPYNLDKWHSYEEANPNTFIAMYQFWCQKVA